MGDSLEDLEVQKTYRILAYGAVLFLLLMGASVLQCVSTPAGPRAPTTLELCAKACGDRFVSWTDVCDDCAIFVAAGSAYRRDTPAQCTCALVADAGVP
jgi:hypothetical protein